VIVSEQGVNEMSTTAHNTDVSAAAGQIADLASSRPGLLSRLWPADERTVADRIADALPGEVHIVTDGDGQTQGWTLLYAAPSAAPSELHAEIVVDAGVSPGIAASAVRDLVARVPVHAPGTGSDSLVVVIDADNGPLEEALRDAGFSLERRFAVEHRLIGETASALRKELDQAAHRTGLQILDWEQVVDSGRTEDVRKLQYLTFEEHWGHLSKSEADWEHFLGGLEFAAEFSGAALDAASGELVGYVLGARSRSVAVEGERVTAHTEYIGVSRSHRRKGVAATLLHLVWAAALDAGLNTASLGVDVENSSNARHLYESLGYRTVGYHAAYRLSGAT
jgi:ribosomal protein S18 acetylase RimI-like enzyme